MCLLKELYGGGVERLRQEHMTFQTPSNKKIDIMTISSNYHIEVNPSDVGIYDKVVIMDLVKTAAQTHQLDATGQKEFKVVVLTEVDHLTKDAQHALRRTMEKYTATCRLILCANSISRVIPAIRSRCLGIRVPAPKIEEICIILQYICKKEGLTLPETLAFKIAEKSERNLRRAILMCEACKVQRYPFSEDQEIMEPDWQVYLKETAKSLVAQQSQERLLDVRSRLYELLTHGIPPDVIFKSLLIELVKNCDMNIKMEIAEAAANYEHSMHKGSKVIFHIEAFVAKFMSIYAKYLENSIAGMF